VRPALSAALFFGPNDLDQHASNIKALKAQIHVTQRRTEQKQLSTHVNYNFASCCLGPKRSGGLCAEQEAENVDFIGRDDGEKSVNNLDNRGVAASSQGSKYQKAMSEWYKPNVLPSLLSLTNDHPDFPTCGLVF